MESWGGNGKSDGIDGVGGGVWDLLTREFLFLYLVCCIYCIFVFVLFVVVVVECHPGSLQPMLTDHGVNQ